MIRTASELLSLDVPICEPPKPSAETLTPVRPSWRYGSVFGCDVILNLSTMDRARLNPFHRDPVLSLLPRRATFPLLRLQLRLFLTRGNTSRRWGSNLSTIRPVMFRGGPWSRRRAGVLDRGPLAKLLLVEEIEV